MQRINLLPLQGITLNGGQLVCFGQTAAEVIAILGKPDKQAEFQLFYHQLSMRLDFDRNHTLEFIELFTPDNQAIEVTIYNTNPFTCDAEQVVEVLSRENNGQIDEDEAPYGYSFLEISVGVWRQICPNDVEQSEREMKENGDYQPEDEQWLAEDRQKSRYFMTIGIGNKDYYR